MGLSALWTGSTTTREEYVHFDSAVGEFLAVMELGRPTGEYLNSQKDFMERKRAEVEKMCTHKYELMEPLIRQRRGDVTITAVRGHWMTILSGCLLLKRGVVLGRCSWGFSRG
ncbi:PREDICTED: HLA class II histocompatibility antigen, DP beta 1 chain-like [Colobus angolensis palliatus]|uniref:HLA class II histocompatibility antigen, DP beta 1 chain-like n=1 Tax=Colobus angolensis palliatus TaxID=336983 RepID=UPI0005F47FC5|nr:PREDICTED: HLA class II histocompatibility antigen, DP beta 1 chain-like [Colobus angolensis palliatus]